jgi:hypothetical protein
MQAKITVNSRSLPTNPPQEEQVRFILLIVSASIAVMLFSHRDVLASSSSAKEPSMTFTISSQSFANGGDITKKFTCDGADVSPQFSWTDPPSGTATFALLADDPDAPVGNWNHWTAWNLPATLRGLPENVRKDAHLHDGTEQGRNDFRKTGYNGPCPPPGKPHRYYFKLFALDVKLDLPSTASKKELEAAMQGHILASAEWMGRYGR